MSLIDSASLIVTPNAYKEGTLYSVIPSDGSGDLSVTRATTATRVNSQGLVELVPYNLLSNTDTFSGWNLESGTLTGGFTAPDGSSTAYKYVQVGSNGLYSGGAGTSPDVKTAQIWIKSVSGGSVTCSLSDGASFIGTLNITGQWQLFTGQYAANSNIGLYLYGISDAAGIYVWHPQVNNGTTALPYLPTTDRLNIPRLDYSNGTCPSILVEPQRTNVLDYSSSFNSGFWLTFNASVSGNTTTSLSGIQDADTLTSNSTTGGSVYRIVNTSGTQTISCFFKAGTSNVCSIGFSNGWYAEYNLSNQTYTTVGTVTASMENYGNGWYRCIITANTNSTLIAFGNSGTTGTTIYIWGAQAELGSYATSYIPTTSASVTRNADAIYKTGATDLIGQTEGTLFVDFVCNGFADYGTPLCINAGSTASSVWITTFGNGDIRGEVYTLGNVQATFTMPGGVVGQRYKVAFVYKVNDFAMYVNGNLIGTDINGSAPVGLNRVDFDYTSSSLFVKSALEINAAALWKTRLTNDELERLTGVGFNTYTEMANYYNYITQ